MINIQETHLKNLLLILLGSFVLSIVGSNLFIYPTFTRMLITDTETEAIMVGHHISNMLFEESQPINKLHVHFHRENIAGYIQDFNIAKLKIFDKEGETFFSTDQDDIGVVNKHDYFRNEVAQGNVFTKVVKKDANTLEGQRMNVDVVETYVPVMRREQFAGALEVYYDITQQKKIISKGVLYCNILSIGFVLFFLLLCLMIARKLDQNIADRDNAQQFLKMVNLDLKEQIAQRLKAEKEKEQVIDELEQSLEKIKVLSGLVPICSFCKNIRNDAGYWEQMEQYVEKYSDAQFSHGLCPACAAKHYPELGLDDEESRENSDPQVD